MHQQQKQFSRLINQLTAIHSCVRLSNYLLSVSFDYADVERPRPNAIKFSALSHQIVCSLVTKYFNYDFLFLLA